MLLSHMSGIRHYEKDAKTVREDREKAKRLLKPPLKEKENEKSSSESKEKPTTDQNTKRKKEFEHDEYYLKDNFESVIQSLNLFKNDPLIFKPGKSRSTFTCLKKVTQFQCSCLNESDVCYAPCRHYFSVLHSRVHAA